MTAVSFLGLGELLWDCFPDRRLPGGAPANVAFHAQQLGLSAATVTRVGCDPLGDEICGFLKSQGLCLDLVQRDPFHGTGTVTVETALAGTKYTFKPDSAWDFLEAAPPLLAAMRAAKAVCFGTLAQRSLVSREAIHACLESVTADCQVVYDVNLRPPFYDREWIERSLCRATIVKLNDDEVQVLAAMLGTNASDITTFAKWLLSQFDIDLACITRGGDGCLLVCKNETVDVAGPHAAKVGFQRPERCAIGPVEAARTNAPLRDESRFPEHAKVLRDGGPAHVEGVRNLARGPLG